MSEIKDQTPLPSGNVPTLSDETFEKDGFTDSEALNTSGSTPRSSYSSQTAARLVILMDLATHAIHQGEQGYLPNLNKSTLSKIESGLKDALDKGHCPGESEKLARALLDAVPLSISAPHNYFDDDPEQASVWQARVDFAEAGKRLLKDCAYSLVKLIDSESSE